MITIREVRPTEAEAVAQLYMDYCRAYSERDARWGLPEHDPIDRWVERTTQTDHAICLVADDGRAVVGFLLASVSGHPAMPGVTGHLEEQFARPGPGADDVHRRLIDAGIAWMRERDAAVIIATVAVDAPWTGEEMGFWRSLGFENDTTELNLYAC